VDTLNENHVRSEQAREDAAGPEVDFNDAVTVFAGATIDIRDLRRDYGEDRIITIGHLRRRMVVVVWTPRGDARHIISMRKANGREQAKYRLNETQDLDRS
jgi:uncharacterized DUF497 family protein